MIQPALVQRAINAALNSEWQTAIEINEKILQTFPEDLDSLNRLARAYLEIGDINKSKKLYKDVLVIDPYNVIAQKNLKRFQLIKGTTASERTHKVVKINGTVLTTFIEEPGKTKVVQLIRPASPQVLFNLHCGEPVRMVTKQRGVQVLTDEDVYVGRLPDDLAHHLNYLMTNGNKYESYVKQIQQNDVFVFIREMSRAIEFAMRPSFNISFENYVSPSAETKDLDGDFGELDEDDDRE
jgi:tetratricopeptide (TPR) repeat protein